MADNQSTAAGKVPLRNPKLALAAVLVSSFMSFFDFTVVYVALPAIQDDLATSYAAVQWVAIGYALPFALLLITGGRIGDILGHRQAFLIGLLGFTLASAVASVVTSVGLLALTRVLQGIAGAVLAPQVLALFRTLVPPDKRAGAMAAYAGTVGLATMSGPILGGVLVGANLFGLGWRSIFLLNVPLGLVALAGGFLCLPASLGRGRLRLDFGGILLATVTLLLLLCPLMYGQTTGWPWWDWAGLAAFLPALAVFIGHQRRRHGTGKDTLIALPLFRMREFNAGIAVNFVVASVLTGFLFVFAVYLQDGLGYPPPVAGATMAIGAVATTVASMMALRLVKRFGRRTLVVGAVLVVVSFGLIVTSVHFAQTPAGAGELAVALTLFGLGTGLVSTPILNMTMSAVPVSDAGSAAGLFTTFRQIGAAVGVALNGVVYFAVLGTGIAESHTGAIKATALFDGGVGIVMLALLLLVPRTADAPAPAVRPVAPATTPTS
ncbi:MFS transporter [Amycolatopsis nigrescens]|uniref:MFS transporter n=1 Tax=Amycolatopsis nigrescens TaxID=381445 RepID=UPI00036DA638|nr:MFS transporter [Amycolatopsis nigrescens]